MIKASDQSRLMIALTMESDITLNLPKKIRTRPLHSLKLENSQRSRGMGTFPFLITSTIQVYADLRTQSWSPDHVRVALWVSGLKVRRRPGLSKGLLRVLCRWIVHCSCDSHPSLLRAHLFQASHSSEMLPINKPTRGKRPSPIKIRHVSTFLCLSVM